VSVYFTSWLLPGIEVNDFWTAIWVALLLGLLNTILKPVLQLISLPLIVFTLGLFLLAINAIILMFVGELVDGFKVDGFWSAVLGSIVISLVSYLIDPPRRGRGGMHVTFHREN